MREKVRNSVLEKGIIIFIVGFFIAASIGRTIAFYNINFTDRFTFIINLFFEIFILYFFFRFNFDRQQFKNVLLLTITFIISQALLQFNFFELNNLRQEILTGDLLQLNKYIFIFFLVPVFQSIVLKAELLHKIFKILKYILYANSTLIILGYVFDFELFKSYPYSERFGYMGIISTNTFTQFIYVILIIYLYKGYLTNKKGIIKLIFFCAISLLIGKKANLLFLILLITYHFCIVSKNKNLYRIIFSTLFISMFLFSKYIINLFIELFPFWKSFDANNTMGILSSMRNLRLQNFIDFANTNWNWANYIFGGVNFPSTRVEMGIIDIYIFFGVVGLIIYFYFYKKLMDRISVRDIILLLLVIIVASLTGSFFVNVNLVIFYFFLITTFSLKDYKY